MWGARHDAYLSSACVRVSCLPRNKAEAKQLATTAFSPCRSPPGELTLQQGAQQLVWGFQEPARLGMGISGVLRAFETVEETACSPSKVMVLQCAISEVI